MTTVNQITVEQLADRLDEGESFALVDTRPPESYEAWHVRGAHNVPFGLNESLDDDRLGEIREIADSKPIVTICAKGLSSASLGMELAEHGFEDVAVVKGGMEEWGTVYEVVPIATDGAVEIYQLQRRAKGCLGYLVGSPDAGTAAAIDVTRQRDEFAIAAQAAGFRITHVLETHVHADHVSGGRQLADELEVPYYLGERARDVDYEFEPLADGDVVTVGDVEITALHTPGHTEEMLTYRVDDEALLTADTVFVESVGRTELAFGEEGAADGARMLYDSIHETILRQPDDDAILPGHVTVAEDGTYAVGSPGEPIATTVGELRESLDLLSLDRDAFVERLTEDVPEKPANYERIVAINAGEEMVTDEEANELEVGPNNCAA